MASVPSNAATRPYTGLPLPLHSSIGLTQAYTTDVGTHTVREQPMSCFAVKMLRTPHQRRLLRRTRLRRQPRVQLVFVARGEWLVASAAAGNDYPIKERYSASWQRQKRPPKRWTRIARVASTALGARRARWCSTIRYSMTTRGTLTACRDTALKCAL